MVFNYSQYFISADAHLTNQPSRGADHGSDSCPHGKANRTSELANLGTHQNGSTDRCSRANASTDASTDRRPDPFRHVFDRVSGL